jgi:histidinol-phosphate phosphatase family protein
MTAPLAYTVVVPTVGRPSLSRLLSALAEAAGPAPAEVVVVDDRPAGSPLVLPDTGLRVTLRTSGGHGPAAARNVGWRLATTEWIAFLDDDVLVPADWREKLVADLAGLPPGVGASQGRIVVPAPPEGRRPTDDERATLRLAGACWITADMAYRRTALAAVGGFDERFPRAYREDTDLALRVHQAGWRIVTGQRVTTHPLRPGGFLTSVRAQAGNAADALMWRKFGRDWRSRAGEGRGRLPVHLAVTATAVAAAALAVPPRSRPLAALAAAAWGALTGEFAVRRILPGPRTPGEIARMVVTSALIPPVAVWHRARGELAASRMNRRGRGAVLFDRDDTLIEDGPYLADPDGVRPLPGAAAALNALRSAGVRIGVVTNQSGVARGLITTDQLAAVQARVEGLLGPFDTWQVCMHGEQDGCSCRKPRPGLVRRAARVLGTPPSDCVVIGDTGADVSAALTAGALPILVPTARTKPGEIEHARRCARVATDITEAVGFALHALDQAVAR